MSTVSQIRNVNLTFLPFAQQGVDCSLQKIAYVAVSMAVLGYILWSASGMGLLPTKSGDWIGSIKGARVEERIL